jgi:Ca2+-binding RTX toxin-like protein/subtilisin-like proprotein convertase family protein
LNIDPVVLDLNGNGEIDLISYQESQVTFDVDNDGMAERTGWVSGGDGVLVHDQNNNEIIDDITETISEYYRPTDVLENDPNWQIDEQRNTYSNHGLEALKKLDSNNDGVFNSSDEKWEDLKIWQDENEDGITDEGELLTLNQAGVLEFDLVNIQTIDKQRNEGNVVLASSQYTDINGNQRLVNAVDFTTNPIGYEFNDVNLGRLGESEEGTKSLIIEENDGANIDLSQIDESSELSGVKNIFGGNGNDTIIGDDQNNWISGGKGSDVLRGGAGHDILIIDENDLQENIDGGEGRDVVIIDSNKSVNFNLTQSNVETVVGGNGDDVLIGGGLSNVFIDGGSGNDIVIGGAADDALSGSSGEDYIDGGYGDDVLRGHRDNDVLIGGLGNDLMDGGLDDDRLYGGAGNDILIGGRGQDLLDGGEGHDIAKYSGSYGDFDIYYENNKLKVKDLINNEIDDLTGIEAIRFDDVTINLEEENTAPLAVKDKITINMANLDDDGSILISVSELIANDIDIENDAILINTVQNAVGGEFEIIKDQNNVITGIKFTPNQNYSGVMSFDYSVKNAEGSYTQITQYNNDGTSQTAPLRARVQFIRSDDPTDPLYYDQWYLSEINVKSVWNEYTGKGITIGVFENGDFNRNHEDLAQNISQNHIQDQEFRQVESFSQHTTTVAGVIAALRNDSGIVGVAYDATLEGYDWTNDEAGLMNLRNVDVANNSWGVTAKFGDNFSDVNNPYSSYKNLLEDSVMNGRNGLGTINVFAGGNQRQEGDNVNYHNLQNSRFSITTGSINQQGDLGALVEASTPFSNPGSAILVSAPGSNIKSTGNLLENPNGSQFLGEFSSSQGTSFSAPIVSGIVALMLEANPNLGYRDVQKILALTAKKFDDPNTTWLENGANNVNGGAMHYSEDYGFGIVDAKAAVRLAESWSEINNFYNENELTANRAINQKFTDNAVSTVHFDISNSNMHNIENVEININLRHADISELTLTLISPSGTRSELMTNPQNSAYNNGLNFTFSSRHFLGEEVDGRWLLEITDSATGNVGTLIDWGLKFYGKLDNGQDDLFIYTDEFANAVGESRALILDDDGGNDTINAAAVSSDVRINLNSGQTSLIAGREVFVSGEVSNEDIAQKRVQLAQNQSQLETKESQLLQTENSLENLNSEIEANNVEIARLSDLYTQKTAQYNASYLQYQQQAEWFNSHTYLMTMSGTLIFQNNGNNQIVQLSPQAYQDKVNAFNAIVNQTNSINSERSSIAQSHDALIERQREIPDEQDALEERINDLSGEISLLQRDIAFDNNYINSFNQNNSTIIENVYSGDGNDILIGNNFDNLIYAGRGQNILTGNGGKDTFVITNSNQTQDVITDFSDEDTIDLSSFATSFNNLNIVQNGSDVNISIGDSELKIILQNYQATLLSESDFIFNKTLFNNVFNGSQEDDLIEANYQNNLIEALVGNDKINALAGNDEIHGGAGNDIIAGGLGNDIIYGDDGNDILYGDADLDFSNNRLINLSQIGNDSLFGGAGNDILSGGGGQNNLTGGSGFDRFIISRISGTADEITDFDENSDIIDLSAINSSNYDKIQDFSDLQITQSGNDVLISLYATGQVLSGSSFYDLNINQSIIIKNKTIDQITGRNFAGITDNANSHENLNINSSDFNDIIITGFGNDIIRTNFGNATINSGAGSDRIYLSSNQSGYDITTGAGNDIIYLKNSFNGRSVIKDFDVNNDILDVSNVTGMKGINFDDLLLSQVNNDVLLSGFSLSRFAQSDILLKGVNLSELSAKNFAGIHQENIRIINGSSENDEIFGTSDNDAIYGNEGDDILNGEDGNDILYGGAGNDTLSDTSGGNQLFGEDGNDILTSGAGNDILNGGAGNDLINGGSGSNILTSGAGADTFIYRINSSTYFNDQITDFDISQDRIDLSKNYSFSTKFSDMNIYQSEDGAVIEFSSSQKITLQGVNISELNQDIFLGIPKVKTINASKFNDVLPYFHDRIEHKYIINGGDGDDVIKTSGNDSVVNAGNGDDEIIISSNNSTVSGGNGSDIFKILGSALGQQNATIQDFDPTSFDKIKFDGVVGVNGFSDLTITDVDGGVEISYISDFSDLPYFNAQNTGDNSQYQNTIILNSISASDLSAENFEFTKTLNSNEESSEINGTDNAENIYSFDDSLINSFGGDDFIRAIGSQKDLIINSGDGDDYISYYLDYNRDQQYQPSVTINSGSGDDNINFSSMFNSSINMGDDNDTLKMYGQNINANMGSGNDVVKIYRDYLDPNSINHDANNTINLGSGNDGIIVEGSNVKNIITGSLGNDIFTFKEYENSNNEITDFEINNHNEKIDLSFWNIKSLSDLSITQNGLNTVITGPLNQTIILRNTESSQLTSQNFRFGTFGTNNSDEITLDSQNQRFFAGAQNDTITFGSANEQEVFGEDGSDNFIVNQNPSSTSIISDFDIGASEYITFNRIPQIESFEDIAIYYQPSRGGDYYTNTYDAFINLGNDQTLIVRNIQENFLNSSHFNFINNTAPQIIPNTLIDVAQNETVTLNIQNHITDPEGDNFTFNINSTAPHNIKIKASENEANGHAQFYLTVNGQRYGEPQTVTANHKNNEWQEIDLTVDGSININSIGIEYFNDYKTSEHGDRNLYVDFIEVNESRFETGEANYIRRSDTIEGRDNMWWQGTLEWQTNIKGGYKTDHGVVYQENGQWYYQANENYSGIDNISLQLTDEHGLQSTQQLQINVLPNQAPQFLQENPVKVGQGNAVALNIGSKITDPENDSTSFAINEALKQHTITIKASENEANGHAQFYLTINGQRYGEPQTVTANHKNNEWQEIELTIDASTEINSIGVEFFNDYLYKDEQIRLDRNLYIDQIEIDGEVLSVNDANYIRSNDIITGRSNMWWKGTLEWDNLDIAKQYQSDHGIIYQENNQWYYKANSDYSGNDSVSITITDEHGAITNSTIPLQIEAGMEINGDENNNILSGQAGNDQINGHAGADILSGGAGNDIFIFDKLSDSSLTNPDLIQDFEAGSDILDLTGLGFNLLSNNNEDGNLSALHHYYDNDNNQTILENQEQGFRVELQGNILLSEGDIVW